jgi:arsenate reductase (glutaredoxin)
LIDLAQDCALGASGAQLKQGRFFRRGLGYLNDMETSVFFNPECTNCQTVRGILEDRGIEADYVRYLEQAPSRSELERVMGLLGIEDPCEMMRAKEPEYDELGLDSAGREELLEAMVAHPILIQRPIVIRGDKAIIARPGEQVLSILSD